MDPRTFKEMRFIFSFNLCGSRGGPAWYRLGDVKRPTSVSRDSETQRLVVGGNSVPSSLSVAGGTHSKCSGCGLQRFPSIFSRNLTQLGNAVEWRFSDCYRVFSQKEMKTWILEFVHFLVMAKGGTSWRCSCCNCSSPKKTFQKTAQTTKIHIQPHWIPMGILWG